MTNIELRGGYFDGERRTLVDFRPLIRLANRPEIGLNEPSINLMEDLAINTYRFTGSVLDDGTRVFQFVS